MRFWAQIRVDPDLRSIPVVVLTSSYAPRDQERSYDFEADHYVTKPIGLPHRAATHSRTSLGPR